MGNIELKQSVSVGVKECLKTEKHTWLSNKGIW
jgi:hypothetical protein